MSLPPTLQMGENHRQPMWDVAEALSNIISEIWYDDRLDPYNHVGAPFKYHVTGVYTPNYHPFRTLCTPRALRTPCAPYTPCALRTPRTLCRNGGRIPCLCSRCT